MEKFEYIKFYWAPSPSEEHPVVLFYEIDLENERYATRMTEIFQDRKAVPVTDPGFPFVTEAPVPTIDEINREEEFFAELISKEAFEKAYQCTSYEGAIRFDASQQCKFPY